ncbi:MAG TPA: hypothetical protein VH092_05855 [Urbifossiella sp.]|jgi:hypothetical protein|nr:hypothetical protein [Urbifossiella sp.]
MVHVLPDVVVANLPFNGGLIILRVPQVVAGEVVNRDIPVHIPSPEAPEAEGPVGDVDDAADGGDGLEYAIEYGGGD